MKKVAGGNTTHYVYGLDGLLYGEYDNTGAMIREYIYLNGEPLAQIDAGSPETILTSTPTTSAPPRYAITASRNVIIARLFDSVVVRRYN